MKPESTFRPAEHPLVARLGVDEVGRAVADRYGAVARDPESASGFPVGRTFAESVRYPASFLDALPAGCANTFTGAGNPHAYAILDGVETLLDLGCGAGLDLIRYAGAVTHPIELSGLDFAEDMVAAARRNLVAANVNARVFCASADQIPLPDSSVDLITANGIFNLSPDKPAIAAEVFRVLRAPGRMTFAEIVLVDDSARPAETLDEWFRCTGGALTSIALSQMLMAAGFESVEVHETTRNARTGHPASRSAVISAFKREP